MHMKQHFSCLVYKTFWLTLKAMLNLQMEQKITNKLMLRTVPSNISLKFAPVVLR